MSRPPCGGSHSWNPHHLVRSGVRAVINQRLLRRVCTTCQSASSQRSNEQTNIEEDSQQAGGQIPHASDCADCAGTGYRGRVAIAQLVRLDNGDPVGEALADTLQAGDSIQRMRTAAREKGAGFASTRCLLCSTRYHR